MISLAKEGVITIELKTDTLGRGWIKFQENTLMKIETYFKL